MKKKIRVLHVVSSLDNGGVEMMLKNYYENIDHSKIHFDFIVHGKEIGTLEKYFIKKGSKIYHVTTKKESVIKNFLEINNIIKNNKYDIVHCHQNYYSFPTLISAKICKIKTRIIHSHGCQPTNNLIKKIIFNILRKISMLFATNYFACGEAAAKWLYGKKNKKNKKNIYIMNNAVNINKFKFNKKVRKEYRSKFDVENKKVLIHVGRFSKEKNHKFLINLIEKLDENFYLILVGVGELKSEIEKYVVSKNIQDKVLFLGKRDDVSNLLMMSDIFLLPSQNEGFPVSVIEAQAIGIDSIISSNVSKEVKILSNVCFEEIDKIDKWVEIIENNNFDHSELTSKNMKKYDIKEQAKNYLKYMEEIL